jgi:hypothetical protein
VASTVSHCFFDELTERAAMVGCDRAETTRVSIALIAWKGQLASSDCEPSGGSVLHIDDESHCARVAGSGFCGFHVLELRFEPSA